MIKPSSNQHFKLWPSAFSPFYSTQDRLFCLTISVNQKLQQPTIWADTRFETAKDSPWQDSWVELSATLRPVITPSSSWNFKLWPPAFCPIHSAQDRQFWLMTSMNQKPQKPNSWVTLDYKEQKDSPWHPSKPCSWVEVFATLRGVIQPSSGEHFKLWPSAFFPFFSAQEIIFCLMTSLNQRPQKPQNVIDTRFKTCQDSPWHSPQLHDIYR